MNVAFSPNERVVITGNSAINKSDKALKLVGFDIVTGEKVCNHDVFDEGESISQVAWTEGNVIICGSSQGNIVALHDEVLSD